MFLRFTKYFLFAGLFISLLFLIKAANAVESFNDTKLHWSDKYAEALRSNCQINGYKDVSGEYLNEFRPDISITRAELVKILVQCKSGELLDTGFSFKDVDVNDWYAPALYEAKKSGWVTGYDDGTFRPNSLINRAEALKIILLSAFQDSEITDGTGFFADMADEWFGRYVKFAVSKNYVSGYNDGTFGPGQNLTRGEAAKIISKVNGYVSDTSDINTSTESLAGDTPQ